MITRSSCFTVLCISFCVVALHKITLSTPLDSINSGLNFANCMSDADCYGDRRCVSPNGVEGDENCFQEFSMCVCVPRTFTKCSSDSNCTFGELCVYNAFQPSHCSIGRDGDSPIADFDDEDSGVPFPECSPDDSAEITVETKKKTYDLCRSSDDCDDSLQCSAISSSSASICMCMPALLAFCENKDDCNIDEDCYRTSIDPPRCASTSGIDNFADKPIKTGNNKIGLKGDVCIGTIHLTHLSRETDLVFQKDIPARVLCDHFGSCATAGHMIVFDDKVMTMATYCDMLGHWCEKRQSNVNSPKYRRALRIASKTPRLFFTVFAARQQSVVEERVLQLAVRIGL